MRYERYCPSCNTVKPLHEFSKSSGNKTGYQGKCKACFKIYQRARIYGITEEQYKALTEHHQGKCGICDKPSDKLVVDHNHVTGKVRGLLCSNCNTALGLFGDSVETLRAAEGYLIHD
jgi:hypothetical protein